MHVEVPIVEVGSWICAVEHRGGDRFFIRADLRGSLPCSVDLLRFDLLLFVKDSPRFSCDGREISRPSTIERKDAAVLRCSSQPSPVTPTWISRSARLPRSAFLWLMPVNM